MQIVKEQRDESRIMVRFRAQAIQFFWEHLSQYIHHCLAEAQSDPPASHVLLVYSLDPLEERLRLKRHGVLLQVSIIEIPRVLLDIAGCEADVKRPNTSEPLFKGVQLRFVP